MVDSDITPIRECVDKKSAEKCSAFLHEFQSTQVHSARPVSTSSNYESDYLDFDNAEAIADKKLKLLKTKKCESVGYAVGEAVASYYEPGYAAGHLAGTLSSQRLLSNRMHNGLTCPVEHLDFSPSSNIDNIAWGKKTFDKEAFNKKLLSKDQDFAQIPTVGPAAAGFFNRVDRNEDGRMSNGEINNALNGDKLNEKEKSVLETIKKNRNSIDNDRDGISMSDLKEFDAKVVQYNKELAMSRKFSPHVAEFARVLHQHSKLVDDDHNGRFSYEELTNFYAQCKKDFLFNPSVEGKRALAALNWGMANFDRYAIMRGTWGRGQVTMDNLQRQILREMDREAPGEMRQYFLSPSDRWRVERYQSTL